MNNDLEPLPIGDLLDQPPPIVPALLVHRAGGHAWDVDHCPYCGRPHRHGAGGPDDRPHDYLGHRVAHCGRGAYYMEQWWRVEGDGDDAG